MQAFQQPHGAQLFVYSIALTRPHAPSKNSTIIYKLNVLNQRESQLTCGIILSTIVNVNGLIFPHIIVTQYSLWQF